MNIDCKHITDKWKHYMLENDHQMQVGILNYGGIITEIIVPDKHGIRENVVLGYKNLADYADNQNCLGAVIGRVAGRIQDATFRIGQNTFPLDKNEGNHHIHGGMSGFHHVVWEAETFQDRNRIGITLTHKSYDGKSGYPGTVVATVTYTLTNDNELLIDYNATTDQTTPLTLTNHTYFNLSGNLNDTIHNHEVMLDSSQFLEVDEELIPTGERMAVAGTPFDFRHGRKLADGIHSTSSQNRRVGNGYDHFFMFDGKTEESIVVTEESSGRVLRIQTNQPGVTMYTANGLGTDCQLHERQSDKHLGVCFETQAPPASLHHDNLPEILLEPGETYHKQTVFTFEVL